MALGKCQPIRGLENLERSTSIFFELIVIYSMIRTTDYRFAAFLLLASLALIVDGSLIFAQEIACGGTIGPGKRIFLKQNLDCSSHSGSPALTVMGRVTFDLKNHTITGNKDIDGIVIMGKRAVVRRGTVTGFRDGVVLAGEGHHRVYKMRAVDNVGSGFVVEEGADYSRLTFNRSIDNGENGYYVDSEHNYLAKNRSEGSGYEGFFVGGNHNKIYLNRSVANLEGFLIFMSDHNRLFHNGAKGNILEGISITAGQQNHIHRNKVSNNGRDGIVIGFWSKGNKIVHNRVKNNGYNGIVAVFGSLSDDEKNLIVRNVVKENGTDSNESVTYYDLNDMNGEATPNLWQNNRYGTKNPETLD